VVLFGHVLDRPQALLVRAPAFIVASAAVVVTPAAAAVVVTRMTGGQVQYIEPIEGDFYCSKSCSSFTQQLAVQLVNPLERIKPSALQKALAKPSHKPQQQGVGAQGGGVTTMKSVIEVSWRFCLVNVCAAVSVASPACWWWWWWCKVHSAMHMCVSLTSLPRRLANVHV
jgi:hypothetical protein